ncbi:MAG TPA: HAD family phosphatase [Thermoleophilaceae bacterium]|nr:HAD family phosphatase [Thermoleophilaceae bacterium]
MIRAVISDFGGVLTTPLVRSFLAFQEHSGVSLEELGTAMARLAEEDGESPLYRLERGQISEPDFISKLQVALGGGVELDGFSDRYFEHLHPNEEMIELMRSLRGRGLRMALLTNNVREWEPLWRAKLPDIDEIFEVIVDSAFVGMRKPEPEIYELTVERLGEGVSASDCLFVDDIDVNCEVAASLGMTAVHYREADQAIAEIETAIAA